MQNIQIHQPLVHLLFTEVNIKHPRLHLAVKLYYTFLVIKYRQHMYASRLGVGQICETSLEKAYVKDH